MPLVPFRPAPWSRTAVLLALLVLETPAARADDAPPEVDPSTIETLTITADPFARTADTLVQPSEVLAGEELDRRRGATLGATLEQELGVSTTDFGRGAGRPVIRGQGGPRVLLLENGIGTMDASDVSSDHEVSIDPAHAEQIEILKGPATLLFGSGASAGVVNVADGRLPSRLERGLRAQVRSGLGSNADERNASARLGYGLARGTQFALDAAWLDSEDYTPGDGAARVRNSAVEKRSGAVSVAQIGDRGSIAASASVFETEYGLPIEPTAFIDLEQDRIDLEARVDRPMQGFESLRLRWGQGDYEHTEFEAPGEPGTVFRNDQDEGRVELAHVPFAGLQGVLGVQRRDRAFQAIGDEAFVPSTDTRALGVFLVERAATGFGSLEFGVRLDREHNDPRDAALRARRFDPVSFSAGALFELNAHYHLKLYATRAQRAPVTEELYSFGPHLATGSFERGRDDFGLERAHNLELSLDRHGDALSWRLNLYAQRIAEYIYQREVDAGLDADGSGSANADGVADRVDDGGRFDPAGDLLLVDYDAADARFWGAEGEIGYAWQAAGSQWRARVFGDLARGRIDGGDALPRMTPARAGAGLHAHRGAWSASLDLMRVLRQDRIASLETATPAYSMLGADLDWTVAAPGGSSLLLFLRGRNLLDQEGRRHTSFIKDVAPLPGASVMAGVEWRIE
jgi:iron complex outermembrane recepter protein